MRGRFIIYGLAGWCIEIFWTGLGSLISGDPKLQGWTYIWMFPIYGLAIFLEPIHNRIRNWPVILRGGAYTLLIFLAEYSTGWLLKTVMGVCPWNYSGTPYEIDGLIRLDFAPAWFAAGILFEKLHDLLMGYKVLKRV
ncbi:hypothetical protein OXPF_12010 [Oxobacter pfennigii]|uniref:ABC-transporter type IV n=1 Tax=Oxobacter pfennigii TaxID=36849 RepID=A0A0P9AIL4_9CLOT|nr:hypothetical protein [Oxobacter pfennigii]KPU45308.1 hypothetical protein OXPF_12010 [Oxobacter pfennigii]